MMLLEYDADTMIRLLYIAAETIIALYINIYIYIVYLYYISYILYDIASSVAL